MQVTGRGRNSALTTAVLLAFGATAFAQDSVDLGRITVKGEGMRESDRAFTVNTLSEERIRRERWESPLYMLEEVPGVDIFAFQHGGVADRFVVRGFAEGGHGTAVGLALDGISLNEGESHEDGYGDTNLIIPLELESVQVFKGPVSPLYGNFSRGGVVSFNTRKSGEYADVHVSGGAYDTFDGQAAFGATIGSLQVNGALQGYESEGWRDHSRYTKMNAALRLAHHITADTEVALSLRGHGGEWEAPNFIRHDQWQDGARRREENPFTALQDDTGSKQLNSQRLDLYHNLTPDLKLLGFAYRTRSDFTRYQASIRNPDILPGGVYPDINALPGDFMDPGAPFNITDVAPQTEHAHGRNATAFGVSLNGHRPIAGHDSHWVVGAEYYDEEADVQRWNTVRRFRYLDRPFQDDRFRIKSTSLYGQMDMALHPRLRPTAGFRYDHFSGHQLDRLAEARTGMNSYNHFSPKLGLRSALTDRWELRASAANGFALPEAGAKYRPEIDVDTVEVWQYEVGVNGAPTPEWYLDLAAFQIDTSDEIVTDPDDPNNLVNAGRTRRTGLEGEARYYPSAVADLEVFAVFAFYDSKVRRNPNPALVGREVPALPRYTSSVGIRHAPRVGWGGQLRLRSQGSRYTNSLNTVRYRGYDVLNGSVFYSFATDRGRSGRIYVDVNNITDEVYSAQVNGAFEGVPTMYSPRPPINAMFGVMLSL